MQLCRNLWALLIANRDALIELKGEADEKAEGTEIVKEDEEVESVEESKVEEKEIKSDAEFKEYAMAILKDAHGDDFDETKATETADGLIDKYGDDYGAMVGALQSTMGS